MLHLEFTSGYTKKYINNFSIENCLKYFHDQTTKTLIKTNEDLCANSEWVNSC